MPWVLYLFIHIASNIHISLYYYRLLRMQTKLRTTCSQGNLGEKENLLAKVSWFLQGKFLQRQHKEILISHHYNEISFFISFFNIRPKVPYSFIWISRTFAYSPKRFVNSKSHINVLPARPCTRRCTAGALGSPSPRRSGSWWRPPRWRCWGRPVSRCEALQWKTFTIYQNLQIPNFCKDLKTIFQHLLSIQ